MPEAVEPSARIEAPPTLASLLVFSRNKAIILLVNEQKGLFTLKRAGADPNPEAPAPPAVPRRDSNK